MRTRTLTFLGMLACTLFVAADAAALDGWHRTREKGLEAASQSGRPLLVVTIWKDGV